MFPCFTVQNALNSGWPHLKMCGEIAQEPPLFSQFPQPTYFCISQFRVLIFYAMQIQSMINCFAGIQSCISKMQMERIHAASNVTGMENKHTRRNRSLRQFIGISVCCKRLSRNRNVTVVPAQTALPQPAGIGTSRFINPCPKMGNWIASPLRDNFARLRTKARMTLLYQMQLCKKDGAAGLTDSLLSGALRATQAGTRAIGTSHICGKEGLLTRQAGFIFSFPVGNSTTVPRTINGPIVFRNNLFVTDRTQANRFARMSFGHREASFHGGLGSVGVTAPADLPLVFHILSPTSILTFSMSRRR